MNQVLQLEKCECSWLRRMTNWVQGISSKVNGKLNTVQGLMTIKTAVEHSMDIVKDVLILIQISLAQGGFLLMMSQEKPYIKGVSKPSKCSKPLLNTLLSLRFSFYFLAPLSSHLSWAACNS